MTFHGIRNDNNNLQRSIGPYILQFKNVIKCHVSRITYFFVSCLEIVLFGRRQEVVGCMTVSNSAIVTA